MDDLNLSKIEDEDLVFMPLKTPRGINTVEEQSLNDTIKVLSIEYLVKT